MSMSLMIYGQPSSGDVVSIVEPAPPGSGGNFVAEVTVQDSETGESYRSQAKSGSFEVAAVSTGGDLEISSFDVVLSGDALIAESSFVACSCDSVTGGGGDEGGEDGGGDGADDGGGDE